eukprot:9518433-Alexandrium_andersonii.AAC.1
MSAESSALSCSFVSGKAEAPLRAEPATRARNSTTANLRGPLGQKRLNRRKLVRATAIRARTSALYSPVRCKRPQPRLLR